MATIIVFNQFLQPIQAFFEAGLLFGNGLSGLIKRIVVCSAALLPRTNLEWNVMVAEP